MNCKNILALAAIALNIHLPLIEGCTDFLLQSQDKAVVSGRSMEFGVDMHSKIAVHPKGQKWISRAPNGQQGLKWTSQYGYVSFTAFDLDCAVDGINEQGLSVGALWLPNSQYQEIPTDKSNRALVVNDLGHWLLGSYKTTQEVRKALEDVLIWAEPIAAIGGIPPLHLAIHDANGTSLVVEFIGGQKKIYDNKIGVLTNAPEFDWQVENLGNYLNLKAMSAGPVNLNGTVLSPPGQGSGLLGIPGDWMPPSRFVRITAFKEFAIQPTNAKAAVNLAFHLLNTVDIPFGGNRTDTEHGVAFDYTQWIVVKDLTNKQLHFRTYDDLNIHTISLSELNLQENGPIQMIPMIPMSN